MKYHLVLLCFAAISLFFIKTAYSVNVSAKYDDPNIKTVYIVKQAFELRCNSSDGVTVRWEKSNKELNFTEHKHLTAKNPSTNVFTISTNKAKEDDLGNYTCVGYNKDLQRVGTADILVAHQMHVKVPTNINVPEGETLKIECQTIGKPMVTWLYRPEDAPEINDTEIEESDRIKFKADDSKITNTILEISDITEADRGVYTCVGRLAAEGKNVTSKCTIRVKGRYAAVWPFVGICIEVIVLCLIIFIYEKKRNKTELEESDTDQSPDQKNTPDNGKDSNLRHRQ